MPPELTREQRAALISRTDDQTVERFVGMIPEQLRPHLAAPMRPLFKGLIGHERQRCVEILKIGTQYHQNRLSGIEGTITAAIASGQSVDELAVHRAAAIESVETMRRATQAISVEPGACSKCGGGKMVPTTIVLPGGQRPMVPCPACVPASAVASAASPGGG